MDHVRGSLANPQTKIKISLTASPIDHSCWRNFKHYAKKNVTVLGSFSGASLSMNIAISFAVVTSMHARPVKLWEAALSAFHELFC